MTIDLVLLGLVLVFGFLGMQSGAIRQLAHWLGLLIAVAGARAAATAVTPYAAPDLGLSPHVVNVLFTGAFFLVFLVLGSWAVRRLLQKLFQDREYGTGDRAFGFLLGAGKGALLLYAVISFYVFFEPSLTKAFGAPPPAVRNSLAVKLARRHDLFDAVRVPALAKFEKLLEAAKKGGGGSLAGQPELQRLLDDPKMKAALQDDSLTRALKSGDLSALKNDPRLQSLFGNPKPAAPAESGD